MGSTVGWQDVVAAKRSERDKLVNIDAPIDFDPSFIIGNVGEYHAALLSGKATCLTTTWSYIQRACETHRLTNCLTEVAFRDAIQRAKELDQHLQETGGLIGPLHGIPVTLKDQFNLKGYDTTLGYVGRAFNPAEQDAALVRILKDLGAVVLAKSNLPQSIMWCETENPLWGLTTHLQDKNYTPGGSTGGEGVLLTSQASCLGWGTDIGGSIRIPSHMEGLYGLKPTSSRLPYRGVPVSTDGQEHVPSSIGPMARSLDVIELAMRSVLSQKPWMLDPRCSPMPWREEAYQEILDQKCLTIGVLFDDGVVTPHPPVTRVLRQAVERLEKAGHDIVAWNAELHAECIGVMDQFYTADGGQDIRDSVAAGGEPLIPHVDRLINSGKEAISVYEYWQLNKQKIDLQQRYLDKWNSTLSPTTGLPADILIMPPMPHVAVPHGGCRWVGYTKVWNFLDYTALVIPAGKVSSQDLQAKWDCEGRKQGSPDEWNAKLWEGNKERMAELELATGIQIVGRKCEEEKVLAAARVIDGLINGS